MKIRRKIYAFALCLALLIGNSLTVFAAPQAMPDGGVFDPEYYAQQYPDVVAAFGADPALLYQHYLICGKAEGRAPYADGAVAQSAVPSGETGLIDNFDPAFYAAAYPDVVAALGTDPAILYQHYLVCGKAEGRKPCAAGAADIVRRQYVPSMDVTVSTLAEAYAAVTTAFACHTEHLVIRNGGGESLIPLYYEIDSMIAPRVGGYDSGNAYRVSATISTVGRKHTLYLDFAYLSSDAEELWLDQFVLGYVPTLEGKSDYEKVLTIHDYLCNRITYDHDTVAGIADQRSAYDGLVDGTGVCTSYALAFQRIAESCGLDSKVLTGTMNGGPHMWNAVNLNGQWYHLDCTWDDQPYGIIRNYFLIGQDRITYPASYEIKLAQGSYR